MRYQVPLFILFTLVALLLNFPVTSQPTQEPEKPMYYPTGNEATLVGTITVKGTLPKPKQIDMTADPSCYEVNRKPKTESVVANQDRLMNVFVYVKSEKLNNYRFELPQSDVILDQRGCRFEPHVFGIRAGQALQVRNSDPTQHNVHPTPKMNPEWNQTQAQDSPPMIKTFLRAEVLIPIRCNQHPWMKAYAGVMNHPFFAVSDKFGRFEIRGLPEGTYKVAFWHEVFGDQELEITVVPGESRNIDITFDADKKP